jgi:carboxyl-terminal processing protease
MRTLLCCFFLLLLLDSCQKEAPKDGSINGTWASIGAGWILDIKDSLSYAFYDKTAISCLPGWVGPLTDIMPAVSLQDDTLSLKKGVITYQFLRTDRLPTLCSTPLPEEKANDPIYNFEVFAATVEEHYTFMELNNIDWDRLYTQQKANLNSNSSRTDLYLTIEETLEQLKDNHAFLEAPDAVYEALEKIEAQSQNEEIEADTLPEYGDFQVAAMVAEHHLQEEMTKDSWLIQWGLLDDETGYIVIKAMWLYADLKIRPSLINEIGYVSAYVETFHEMYEGTYIEKEAMGVRKIMEKVINDLSDTKSIIIDVRFNGGGQDAVSFEILSHFLPQRLQVATQKLKDGDQYTAPLPLFIDGKPDAYTNPVYVLTSPQTGSAAEAFSIATMAMTNVRRIGSPTSGAMSTALEKTLPNGWPFAISNEVYMDNEGNNYENQGIPVDYDLGYARERQPFFRRVVKDLDADKRAILQAIDALKE